MIIPRRFDFRIILLVILSVHTCTSLRKDPRRSSNSPGHRVVQPEREEHRSWEPLRRSHRQAQDSYEEGVEYEYEEEAETESSPTIPPEPETETEIATEEAAPTEEVKQERGQDGDDEYYETYDENGNEETGNEGERGHDEERQNEEERRRIEEERRNEQERRNQENTERTETEVDETHEEREHVEEAEIPETTSTPESDSGSVERTRDVEQEHTEEEPVVDVNQNGDREFEGDRKREDSSEDYEDRGTESSEDHRRRTEFQEEVTERTENNVIVPEQAIVESGREDLERYRHEPEIPKEEKIGNEIEEPREFEENEEISRSEERENEVESSFEAETVRPHRVEVDETDRTRPDDTRRGYEGEKDEDEEEDNGHSEEFREVDRTRENAQVSAPTTEIEEPTEPPRREEPPQIFTPEPPRRLHEYPGYISETSSHESENHIVPVTNAPSRDPEEEEEVEETEDYEVEEPDHRFENPRGPPYVAIPKGPEISQPMTTEGTIIVEPVHIPTETEDEEEERYEGRRFNGKNKDDGETSSSLESSSSIEVTETTTPRPPEVGIPGFHGNQVDSSENRIFDEKSISSETDDVDEVFEGERKRQETFGQTFSQEEISTKEDPVTAKIECFPGYQLSSDGLECLDIDECTQSVCGSTQICANLPGTYRCTCSSGFIKDFRNERMCRDLNECEIGNGGCSHDCINTQGSYYCTCADAYDLSRDDRTCVLRPTTATTTTTTTTTTRPTTTTTPTPVIPWRPKETFQHRIDIPETTAVSKIVTDNDDVSIRNCPTPPVPRGSGIAYLYCSRSPVGIHHRHSQLERQLIQDWTARRNRSNNNNSVRNNNNLRFRNRRNLKRRPRQTTYSPGSMCELRCRSGFELKGQYTLHCNAHTGGWQGTTNGFCQAIPKVDSQNLGGIGLSNSETTPSNEIPRLAPNPIPAFSGPEGVDFIDTVPFRPTYAPYEPSGATFRSNFYQPPTTTVATRRPQYPYSEAPDNYDYRGQPRLQIPPPVSSTPVVKATTTTTRPYYSYNQIPTTMAPPLPTTSRNSFIQFSYRFKTPWIKCPDDITIDVPLNQSLAYVIIPQPQTNADWWREVTSEPSWAKGLETEIGPGKYQISFRARTSAPYNNTAECSFVLDVRDSDPPRVRECPESFTVKLSPGQSARHVNWIEPHFSDNIRITSIKKSHETGTILAVGEHLINYEARDASGNQARCSFTVTVVPPSSVSYQNQNGFYRKPFGTEAISEPTTPNTSPKPADTYPPPSRNVVCHVGKKGRRIVFQSKVVPRGCTEMTTDLVGDLGQEQLNTLNTVTQNSAENSATSQISSVSFSSNDHPQSSSAFSQAVSNGRNQNRQVHSTSSVTNNAHGTNSRASSYAIALSSSSRNFDNPFLTDKQVYEDDFVVPTFGPKIRSGQWGGGRDNIYSEPPIDNVPVRSRPAWRTEAGGRVRNNNRRKLTEQQQQQQPRQQQQQQQQQQPQPQHQQQQPQQPQQQQPQQQDDKGKEPKKYFRHFDSWDTGHQSRDRSHYAH